MLRRAYRIFTTIMVLLLPTLLLAETARGPVDCYVITKDGKHTDLQPLPIAEWVVPAEAGECPVRLNISYMNFPAYYRFESGAYFKAQEGHKCMYNNVVPWVAMTPQMQFYFEKGSAFCFLDVEGPSTTTEATPPPPLP